MCGIMIIQSYILALMEVTMKGEKTFVILIIFLCLSLSVNIIAIFGLNKVRTDSKAIIEKARIGLELLSAEKISLEVSIDQLLPLETEIVVNEIFTVPIDTTYPIDTTIYSTINLPLVGTQRIAIPIKGTVPIKTIMETPVKLSFPISTEYHLKTTIPVEISIPPEVLDNLIIMLDDLQTQLK